MKAQNLINGLKVSSLEYLTLTSRSTAKIQKLSLDNYNIGSYNGVTIKEQAIASLEAIKK